MPFLSFLLLWAGFCALYAASPKTAFRRGGPVLWAQTHRAQARLAGGLSLFLAFVALVRHYGLGTGIYFGFLTVMAFYGLAILLIPVFTARER